MFDVLFPHASGGNLLVDFRYSQSGITYLALCFVSVIHVRLGKSIIK